MGEGLILTDREKEAAKVFARLERRYLTARELDAEGVDPVCLDRMVRWGLAGRQRGGSSYRVYWLNVEGAQKAEIPFGDLKPNSEILPSVLGSNIVLMATQRGQVTNREVAAEFEIERSDAASLLKYMEGEGRLESFHGRGEYARQTVYRPR